MKEKTKNKTKSKSNRHFFRIRAEYCDYNLLAIIILLTCFGLIMLYSTSAYDAVKNHNGNDMYFLKSQIKNVGIAVVIMILAMMFDYHYIWYAAAGFYLLSNVLMLLVKFSPLGVEYNSAKRWLRIGPVQFQPSELAKIAVITFLPVVMIFLGKKFKEWQNLTILLLVGAIPAVIALAATDNLSTAIIIMGIAVIMILVGKPETKKLEILCVIAAVVSIIFAVVLGSIMETSTNFRIRRILAWMHPEANIEHEGYQILQAQYAIGSGGFWGKGLGNSLQKLGFIPEAQNDMVFPIICEELGIFGAMLVLLMFGYLLYRLAFIVKNAPDFYGSMLVAGVFAHIGLQVLGNVCVAVRLLPTTGITLPFISFGGTSFILLMAEMGMALSVSRSISFQNRRRKKSGNRKSVREDAGINGQKN